MNFIRHNQALVISVVVILVISSYLVLTPWVDSEIGPFYGPKASGNSYLAAELFLERFGVTIERKRAVSNLKDVLDQAEVLLMTGQNGVFSRTELEQLLSWIRQGGILIYQPTTLYSVDETLHDALLNHFSKRLVVNPEDDRSTTPLQGIHHSRVDCPDAEQITTISLRSDRNFKMNMSRRLLFSDDAAIDSTKQPIYIEDGLGKGRLVLLTGLRQWRNNLIQCNDNALVLRLLVLPEHNQEATLIWVDGVAGKSINSLLWQWFPETIVSLFVLLLFWVWNRIVRDRLIESGQATRLNSLEDYLLKKAAFRWRNKKSLCFWRRCELKLPHTVGEVGSNLTTHRCQVKVGSLWKIYGSHLLQKR